MAIASEPHWMGRFNFSERLANVITRTREYASRRRHEYVGTEHLLAGLMLEEDGVAAAVLANLGIDSDAVVECVDRLVPMGAADVSAAMLPYTSRAKKVLELAVDEARSLQHSYFSTEHLLLGLLAEEKGIGAQILAEFGVRIEVARAETLRLLGPNTDQRSSG